VEVGGASLVVDRCVDVAEDLGMGAAGSTIAARFSATTDRMVM